MARFTLITAFLTACLFAETIATTSDLTVLSVSVTTPVPNDGATSFISGVDTYTELDINIFNFGGDALPTTADGNFDLILSLEHAETNLQYSYTFNLTFSTSDQSKFSDPLASTAGEAFSPNATITIPTEECGNLSYICVTIDHNVNAGYDDDDSTNDFACIAFGDGSSLAGIKECTADLQPNNFTITDPSSNFVYKINSDRTITVDLEVDNIGWEAINETDDGSSNYDFTAYISTSDDLDEVNVTYVEFSVDTSSAYNLSSGIAAGGSMWIYGLQTDINIPSEDCEIYEYLCFKVSVPTNADYTDGDTSNNEVCIEFGDVEDGYAGNLPCSGCALKFSLGLVLAMIMAALGYTH